MTPGKDHSENGFAGTCHLEMDWHLTHKSCIWPKFSSILNGSSVLGLVQLFHSNILHGVTNGNQTTTRPPQIFSG